MSFLGFFKSTIDNWYNLKKKTPAAIKEMKNIIRQYEWSKFADDFINEDEIEVKELDVQIKKIYKEIYQKGEKV